MYYNLNPVFKTKKILNFVKSLISDYDYQSINDLSHADKCELAGLLVEASGDNEALIENADSINKIIKHSLVSCIADDMDNMFDIKSIIVDYYHAVMDDLINYCLAEMDEEIADHRFIQQEDGVYHNYYKI